MALHQDLSLIFAHNTKAVEMQHGKKLQRLGYTSVCCKDPRILETSWEMTRQIWRPRHKFGSCRNESRQNIKCHAVEKYVLVSMLWSFSTFVPLCLPEIVFLSFVFSWGCIQDLLLFSASFIIRLAISKRYCFANGISLLLLSPNENSRTHNSQTEM